MSAYSRKDFFEVTFVNARIGGSRGGAGPTFYQTGRKKCFWRPPLPPPRLSKDLDDRAPSVSQGLELVTGTGHPLKPDPLNHVNTGKVIHAKFPREQSFICCFILQPETPTNESY